MSGASPEDPEDIELKLFLEGLYQRYGYDFRGYAEVSIRRRVKALMRQVMAPSISHLQGEVLGHPEMIETVLAALTVPTSELFRDPSFYRALREHVVPVLRTYPSLKIWHAGCSTGEEIYSLAILLAEEGLDERATIYATDINPAALATAQEGIYPIDRLQQATANYQAAGGKDAFSTYYTAAYGGVRLDPVLRRNVVFATHNLATDDIFAETQLILCRNVFIYFMRELQERALDLFTRSLCYKGFLCLGTKETVRFLRASSAFDELPDNQRIFRKVVMS